MAWSEEYQCLFLLTERNLERIFVFMKEAIAVLGLVFHKNEVV